VGSLTACAKQPIRSTQKIIQNLAARRFFTYLSSYQNLGGKCLPPIHCGLEKYRNFNKLVDGTKFALNKH